MEIKFPCNFTRNDDGPDRDLNTGPLNLLYSAPPTVLSGKDN